MHVWNIETGWVHAVDDITFQVDYDKNATLVSRVDVELEPPAVANPVVGWRIEAEAVSQGSPVEDPGGGISRSLSGIGMISIRHSTWACKRPTINNSDDDDLDPDYSPSGSMDSQSELDSEDEYIEKRTRRARGKPISPAKPGEGAMGPVTTVKQEPESDGAPRWAPVPDTAVTSEQAPSGIAPRWSSIMEEEVLSDLSEAVEVPRWASVEGPTGSAPRLEPRGGQMEATGPSPGSADPTLEQPSFVTLELEDGTSEEYIIKSEIASSEDEAGAPPFQQLSQGNAMAAVAIPVGDGVVNSDSLFTRDELCEA